ncbi:MAG: ATP-binding cassette domain-containing protein, partial [Methylobacteriaceae bacterium]|nr:ATP-binding cassette domain-containing protein [Methylobacteriaceae bacterium]
MPKDDPAGSVQQGRGGGASPVPDVRFVPPVDNVLDEEGVLSARGLRKSYRGRVVVMDASLHVRRGEAVGLLGPNGAGKTTI